MNLIINGAEAVGEGGGDVESTSLERVAEQSGTDALGEAVPGPLLGFLGQRQRPWHG